MPKLGRKLRALRRARGMTLLQTAASAGLSVSFISALERGNCGVSLDALFRLCEALGTTIPSLHGNDPGPAKVRHTPAGERRRFVADGGLVVIEDIITKPAGMEAEMVLFLPGADSGTSYAHKGQEFIHILEGELSIWLDPGEHYTLGPGDTLYLHSEIRHRWANRGATPARVIWVNAALPGSAHGDEPARESVHARLNGGSAHTPTALAE